MSSLSPTMTSGKIQKWNVKVGDKVEIGDVIAEIETDKAQIGFEVTDEGYVNKILKQEGTGDINIGEVIAELVEDEEDIGKDFNVTNNINIEKTIPNISNKETENLNQLHNQSKEYPDHTLLTMPTLSPTMEKGKVLELLFKEGDKVDEGDSFAKIETDKAIMDFESQEEGYIAKLFIKEGDSLNIGESFLVLVDDKTLINEFKDFTPNLNKNETNINKEESIIQENIKSEEINYESKKVINKINKSDNLFISPNAKRIAKEKNIDYKNIIGTGPNGRIITKNINEYKSEIKIKNKPDIIKEDNKIDTNLYEEVEISNIRNIIAKRLQLSKQTIPHYYLEKSINLSNLLKFRSEINQNLDSKISLNDYIIKAVAKSNEDVPEVNSQWHDNHIKKFKNVDVSIAVDIGNGLITPIIPNANKISITDISLKTKELINKAKENKLLPHEFQGGTISISNLGMMGIDNFSAVINPPQSCILAVGRTKKVMSYDSNNKDSYKWIDEMNVTLSCDHRVVDGAIGAKWLQRLQYYLENPIKMLL